MNLITDAQLDLRNHVDSLDPSYHGALGAQVGGGNPLLPLLRDFVTPDSMFKVPTSWHRSYRGFPYGMLGNDEYGDCVLAAIYHAIMHGRKAAGRKDVPPGDDKLTQCTLGEYGVITGFKQGDPSTDQGTDPTEAWAYWQRTGMLLPDGSRDKIAGSVQVLPHDGANVRRGIAEFDCVGLSLALPVAWQREKIWTVGGDPQRDPDWQPGGWGGHEVLGVSYDTRHIAFITWGGVKLMSWQALGTYGTLVLCQVSPDVIGKGGVSDTGLNYDTLARDLPQL